METLTVGQRVCRAILEEASSIKAGNVHPQASFSNMTYRDFQVASEAIGRAIDASMHTGSLGQIILASVQAMVQSVSVNTSLGTILLMVPMALCPNSDFPNSTKPRSDQDSYWNPQSFHSSVSRIIQESTSEDSQRIYDAIRTANPGGLGKVQSKDLAHAAPVSILEAMQQASRWDDVALQYANGYQQITHWTLRLLELNSQYAKRSDAIRKLQIEILASRPDSLIVRKSGMEVGKQVQGMAAEVMQSGPYASPAFEASWKRLDEYLREDGHRKNPGTVADLIAATVFLASYAWEPSHG
jgi:triphosphoribosyl-dephospho-CoA synthase